MPKGKRSYWLFLLLLVAAVLTGYRLLLPARHTRPNVLWITMDSLRSDHLGCYGYEPAHTPNIDGLAAQGALFSECLAQASYTRISVPSMITGKYPFFLDTRVHHGDLDASHLTMAEVLAGEGYFTCAIAENWPPGFFQGVEALDVQHRQTTQKTQRCIQFLQDLDGRPFFIWLYYWDPHAPYEPPQRYRDMFQQARTDVDTGSPDEGQLPAVQGSNLLLLSQLNQGKVKLTGMQQKELVMLYDAEIAFVDAGIGEVVRILRDLGLWDDTLVILSADHGEAFGEHGMYYHSHTLYDEEVRVPCIIKPPHPRREGMTIPGPVRNLDIFPTVLDYCGIPLPSDIQGQSLRPFLAGEQKPRLFTCLETHSAQLKSHLMAYRTDGHKLIYNLSTGETELYDLAADPGERDDLLPGAAPGSETARLESELKQELLLTLGAGDISDLEVQDIPEMDPQTRDQLKALGYIE
jgi:arylsulfatase A-like enzyme